MLSAHITKIVRPSACLAVAFLLFSPSAKAQVSFAQRAYQAPAPPPADFGNNVGYGGSDSPLSKLEQGFFASLPVHLTLSARQGYDSNVFTTKDNPQGSMYSNVAGGATYAFGSPRFRMNSSLGGGVTYYYTRPGDKVDLNGTIGGSLTYLATPRLTLTLTSTTSYLSQPDLTIVGGTNREDGDYFVSNTGILANYQLTPIFSTTTGYNFNAIYYMDSNLNSNQGNISQSFSESFNWLWKPTTTLFLVYTANPTTYYQADLNQFANYFAAGFTHTLNPKSSWTARLGAQVNFNNNSVDGQSVYVGPYGETTLNYKYSPTSSLFLNMRYGTEASGLDNVTQRQTFRVGFGANHFFSQRLSATVGLNYQCNYYDQTGVIDSFIENVLDTSLTVNYQFSRLISLSAGYQFITDIAPQATYREYNRNVVFAGANFAF